MKKLSLFTFVLGLLLSAPYWSKGQTTIQFNDVDGGGYALSYSEGGFSFSINDPGNGRIISSQLNGGYGDSKSLWDNNPDQGAINRWTIKKTNGTAFKFIGIYLRDPGLGASTSGTITAYKSGSKIGTSVPTAFNGSYNQSFATNDDFSDVDEIRIEASDINFFLDHFTYDIVDNDPPTGYTVSIDQNPITVDNQTAVSFTFTGAEVGTTHDYTFTSSGGGTPVTGSGTVATATQQVAGIDLSGLSPGTVTLSVTLTDASNNVGAVAATAVEKIVNNAPSNIILSSNSINQSTGTSATVGTLSTTDLDAGDTHTYALVPGTGNDDNGDFNISGNLLLAPNTYLLSAGPNSIRIRTTDNKGGTYEKAFTITVVDDVAPTVSSVSVPANATYVAGQDLDFTVNVTENVMVTGTPQLPLTIGTTTVNATYTSGSTTNSLLFRYTVQAGETDTDGIGLGTSIQLNSGTIRDGASLPLTLALNNVGSTTGVLVDGVNDPPTVSGLPAGISIVEDTNGNLDIASSNFADEDSDEITVTLSVSHGTIGMAASGGIPVVLTGNGPASIKIAGTPGAINQYINTPSNIIYTPPADLNGTAAAILTVSANDGDGSGDVELGTVPINITGVNDAPEIITSGGTTTFTESDNGSPTSEPIDLGITVSDPDNNTLASATASITGNFQSGEDILAFVNDGSTMGNIDGSYDAGTGVLSLISAGATATLAQWNAALQAVTYSNNSSNPNTANRAISFVVNDGIDNSAAATKVVAIQAVNNAPAITNVDGDAVTFTEGGPVVLIDAGGDAMVSDPDSPDFDGGTLSVTIVTNEVAGEDIVAIRNEGMAAGQIGVVGGDVHYDGTHIGLLTGGTGGIDLVVTFLPTATRAAAQALIKNLTYSNLNTVNPSLAPRTIRITLRDGDGGTSANNDITVNITAVNDVPTITTTGGSVTFTEPTDGDPVPVAIDPGLTVADPDNTTLSSATVSITGNFQAAEDILAFVNDGGTMDNIAGSYEASTGVLTLTSAGASATLTEWQAALQAITYSNSSQDPSTATRTISFVVNDGIDASSPATKDLNVVAVNSAPIAVDDEIPVTEDIRATGNVLTNDSDPEGNMLTVYLVTPPQNGTVVLNPDGSFNYMPNSDYADLDSLEYQVCDNGVSFRCDTAWVHFTIEAVNDAPTITILAIVVVDEDVPTPLTGISFSDIDAGNADVTTTFSVASGTLSATSGGGVTASGSGTGVLTLVGSIPDINAFVAAGSLAFTTALNRTNNVMLTVGIDDGGNTGTDPGNSGTGSSEAATIMVTLAVTAVNDVPVNVVPVDQTIDQDGVLVFSTGNGNAISVSDVDAGGGTIQVTLTATNGVTTLSGTTGLTFISGSGTNDATMTFQGTIADINNVLEGLAFMPTSGYNGAASLEVATDDLGASGSGGAQVDTDVIGITVNPTNPRVMGVGSTDPDGLYKLDDVITLTVLFDQPVTVDASGGSPTLLLETGSTDREADYQSGSGTNTLTFSYTVQAGDANSDLDYPSATALALNGATIQSASDEDAVLSLPAVGGASSIAGQHALVIDGIVPAITSVAVPANGYYRTGDVLGFTVHTDDDVTVDDAGGTPYLEVMIGAETVVATYTGGTGSDALSFSYTVQAADQDLDGIVLGSDIVPDGGNIRDVAGNGATLMLNNVASTAGVFVYSVRPLVTLSTSAASPENAPFTVTVTFSEAVTGFALGDITTTNATLSDLQTDDNMTYTLLVAPSVDALVSLSIPADAAVNIGNNGNMVSNTLELDYDGTAPVPPAGLATTAGDKEIGLEWIASVEADVVSYRVYGGMATDPPALLETVAAPQTTFIHTALTNGIEYSYRISALDEAGNESPLSATVSDVPMANQAITFDALAAMNYGDDPLMLTATASSGLPVTYTSSNPAIASVSGNVVTIHAAGMVSLTANQGGDMAFHAASSVSQTLTVNKATINVAAEAKTKVHGTADPALTYTHSGLVAGDTESVFTGALAREAGDDVATYSITQGTLAAGDNYTITFTGADFSITSAIITGITLEDGSFVYDGMSKSLAIAGNLPDGTAVSYTGNSRTDVGTQEVTATISGGNYQDLVLTADLSITSAIITGITLEDGSFVYDGTSKSLAIVGNLPDGTAVSYAGNSRTDVGSQEVTATISGGNYEDLVLAADLSITSATITGITLEDGSFAYDGTSKYLVIKGNLPDGAAVSYAGNSRMDVGTQEVTATISGANYTTLVLTADLTIKPATRSIDFPELPAKTYGDADFDAGAIASSGEELSYTSSDARVAEIANGQIHITGAGTATITATVPENGNYANRPSASRTLVVAKADQQITFAEVGEVGRDAGGIPLEVSSSSGLEISLSVDDAQVAALDGQTLDILRLGTVRVTATQTGDGNYNAATPVTITIRVVDADDDLSIRVHKALSPNGDGINDFMMVEGIKEYPENRLIIMNRNGGKVTEIIGYNNSDRVFRGIGPGNEQLSSGTYYYLLEVKVDGKWKYRKGYFVVRY